MRIIKLKVFPVPVRLHSGYGTLFFVTISPFFAIFKNVVHSLKPGSKLCTTFLNIAKYGEITTNFNLPEPECNRTGTGNTFNVIMRMTVQFDGLMLDYGKCELRYTKLSCYRTGTENCIQ